VGVCEYKINLIIEILLLLIVISLTLRHNLDLLLEVPYGIWLKKHMERHS
jgi:hypothetical protein